MSGREVTVLVATELLGEMGDWSQPVRVRVDETPGTGAGYEMTFQTLHGDTRHLREQIAEAIRYVDENADLDRVMAVVAPILAARDAAVEDCGFWRTRALNAERLVPAQDRIVGDLQADLAAARQQLDQVRRAYHAWNEEGLGTVPGLRATNWPDAWRDIGYELDAPARPAGHDESGQP